MARVRSKAAYRAAGLFAASAAVVFTAACGGGSDSATGASTPAGGGNGSNAFTAYVECLNKNGVTVTMPSGGVRNRPSDGASREPREFPSGMPRPSGSAGARGGRFPGGGGFGKPAGVDDATWQKAQAACASVRPSGRPGMGNGGGSRRNAAYENCLKDNGVTSTENLDPTNATAKKAMETCKVLRQPAPSATPTA